MNSDYNLGRIVDKAVTNASELYMREGVGLFFDGVHYQTGTKDVFSFGQTILGALVTSQESAALIGMLPEFDFKAAIGPANRIACVLVPMNLFFILGEGGGGSGFKQPFYMLNGYKWDFLSNGGRIRVSPNQFENAFYFKPLVNAGQVRLSTNLAHSIGDLGKNLPKTFNVASVAAVGIQENLQVSGGVAYRNNRSVSSYSSYKYYDEGLVATKTDSLKILGNLDFRINSFSSRLGYSFSSMQPSSIMYPSSINDRQHRFSIDAAYFLGSHITSLDQVMGNWDGFFSPLLNANQLLTQAEVEYISNQYSYLLMPYQYFSIRNGIHYGLLRYCTIGENFDIIAGKKSKPSYSLHLLATVMNIPIREKGPSQVSSFEYLYGYWPRKGQVRADCSWHVVPMQKKSVSTYESATLLDYSFFESAFGEINKNQSLSEDPFSTFGWARSDPLGSKLLNSDLFFKLSVGVSEYLVISNAFETRVDRYLKQTYGSYQTYYGSPSWQEIDNMLYFDNFGLSIITHDRGAFTLMASLFGQTDEQLSERDKLDYLISAIYQGVF